MNFGVRFFGPDGVHDTPKGAESKRIQKGVSQFRATLETEKLLLKSSPFPVKQGKGAGGPALSGVEGMGFPEVFDVTVVIHG